MYLPICLFVCLSVRLFVYLSMCLSICASILSKYVWCVSTMKPCSIYIYIHSFTSQSDIWKICNVQPLTALFPNPATLQSVSPAILRFALDMSLCDWHIEPQTRFASGQLPGRPRLEPAFAGITRPLTKMEVSTLLVTPGECPQKEAMYSPAVQAPLPKGTSPREVGS